MTGDRRLFAVMCTYRRPDDVARSLEALGGQDLRPDLVVVVDNGSDSTTRGVVEACGIKARYVDAGANLGPAGGNALAIKELDASDDDLVLMLDDDDALPSRPDLLRSMVSRLDTASAERPSVAGVGLRGGHLDLRTGVIESSPGASGGVASADHLHGCAYPIYRIGPLRGTGAFDPGLFWGFEELSAGRTLTAAGYELVTDGDLLASVVDELPKLSPARRTEGLPERSWRHYYRHRNLLRVLKRERAWRAIAMVVTVRLVAKPILWLPRSPRLAWWHLCTNMRAILDGLGDESRMSDDSRRRPT